MDDRGPRLSLQERVQKADSIRDSLVVIAEGLDTLLKRRRPGATQKEERHLESADVLRIFRYWMTATEHPQAILTEGRRTLVKQRLKEGYAVDRIIRAIDGCTASDFHMARGQYQGQRKYDDLNLICRSGAKLEEFESIPLGPEKGGNRKFLG